MPREAAAGNKSFSGYKGPPVLFLDPLLQEQKTEHSERWLRVHSPLRSLAEHGTDQLRLGDKEQKVAP